MTVHVLLSKHVSTQDERPTREVKDRAARSRRDLQEQGQHTKRMLKVPRAPKWFDFEFPIIKTKKLLVETRSGTWAKRIYPCRSISSCRAPLKNGLCSMVSNETQQRGVGRLDERVGLKIGQRARAVTCKNTGSTQKTVNCLVWYIQRKEKKRNKGRFTLLSVHGLRSKHVINPSRASNASGNRPGSALAPWPKKQGHRRIYRRGFRDLEFCVIAALGYAQIWGKG